MSNKCEICYDTNMDYCITQDELDKALEGMLSKDELRYYTTQEQVDLMIEESQIQTENKISHYYYNKTDIDNKGYLTSVPDIYVTENELNTAISNIPPTDLSNYYNKTQIDTMIGDIDTILNNILYAV